MYDVIIIGGGLAGLTFALHISKNHKYHVLLIEKYPYPHHKVCGEYVSNEVLPYLKQLDIDPFSKGALPISQFEISNHKGHCLVAELPLGGFGISRYQMDNYLYENLKDKIKIVFDSVEKVFFQNDFFKIETKDKKEYNSKFVVGAYGKRSNLDTFLQRKFIQKKSHWLAVKAHYHYNHPVDTVSLHNFEGGYCGISKVENDIVNACYLTTYKSFQKKKAIDVFQKDIMSQNPNLKHFFENATMLFEKPITISQVSFEKKKPVENHIFMIGDGAGLIHPLCGNGMAMAIHSAKICTEVLIEALKKGSFNRNLVERSYKKRWNQTFSKRLKAGRFIQKILLNPFLASIGLKVAKRFPSIIPIIIKKTHGQYLR